ncbi:MAG: hypothetical protein AAFQ94_28020 [Bacteroidota bacterium]
MSDFSKVGLGFAEFVSQLLQETFDATLSAQNYQVEKYLELEKALSLPESLFRERYLTDEDVSAAELEVFGVSLQNQMTINDDLLNIITEIAEDSEEVTVSEIVNQNKLTDRGFDFLGEYVISFLIETRKNSIQEMINRNDMARLVVDSGEINTKLEFSNVSLGSGGPVPVPSPQRNIAPTAGLAPQPIQKSDDLPIIAPGDPTDRFPPPDLIDDVVPVPDQPVRESASGITPRVKTRELIDPETNERTILLEKDSLEQPDKISSVLPGVRLIARPVRSNSSSNIYSEITIKFRTV